MGKDGKTQKLEVRDPAITIEDLKKDPSKFIPQGVPQAAIIINKKVEYSTVFQFSMSAALVGALLLLLFFHPPKEEVRE